MKYKYGQMSELKKRLENLHASYHLQSFHHRQNTQKLQTDTITEFCREVFNREFMKNKSTRDTLIEVMRELGIEL